MKARVYLAACILYLGFSGFCASPGPSGEAVKKAFLAMESSPSVLKFRNNKDINNSGGHLQGIQLVERPAGSYAVLTGSSDSHSYCAVVSLGDKMEVISVNNLMDKPFKHAGGCQVFRNFLAVGIEDNAKKDRSKVCIFDLANPAAIKTEPLAVIPRSGEPMRSTAGCAGMTAYRDKMLLAVGDWDTKHLDLYIAANPLSTDSFKNIFTIDTGLADRDNWSDSHWWPYQNIQLFTISDSEIYLVGLGQNDVNEDIADLYTLKEEGPGHFSLKKLATKTFRCSKGVSFKAGAGVSLDGAGNFSIIACGYNIGNESFLNLFAPAPR